MIPVLRYGVTPKYEEPPASANECIFRGRHAIGSDGCKQISVVAPHNERCCKANCTSEWRACRACIVQSSSINPGTVVDPKTGLCQWHIDNGESEVRPEVTNQALHFSQVSLPSGRSDLGPSVKKSGKRLSIPNERKFAVLHEVSKSLLVKSGRDTITIARNTLLKEAQTVLGGDQVITLDNFKSYWSLLSEGARSHLLNPRKTEKA